MRTTIAIFSMLFLFLATSPAEAQFRTDGSAPAAVQIYTDSGVESLLNTVFSSEHFRMGHSYEMSHSSFGGNSMTMGMYTNTMMWQFNDQLAARVDVSLAQPFVGNLLGDNQQPQLFLRNAEIAYRPTENTTIHFQMQQSPYGRHLSPYGQSRYSAFGAGGSSFNMQVGTQPRTMFWREGQMNY